MKQLSSAGLILLFLLFSFTSLSATEVTIKKHTVKVDVVVSQADQAKGLGGRKSLSDREGMLFVYSEPGSRIFWMKGMYIPIDIIWILNNKIVLIEEHVPPPAPGTRESQLRTYGHGVSADTVLEVKAGSAATHSWKVGDYVTF